MLRRFWILIFTVGVHARMEAMNEIEIDEPRKLNKPLTMDINKPALIDFKPFKWSEILSSTEKGLIVSEKRFNRQSWCRSQVVRLQLSEPGCTPRVVLTRLCFGQCNSFFIPRPDGIFQSCPSCRASKGSWLTPALSCGRRQVRRTKIFRVKKCKCLPTK